MPYAAPAQLIILNLRLSRARPTAMVAAIDGAVAPQTPATAGTPLGAPDGASLLLSQSTRVC